MTEPDPRIGHDFGGYIVTRKIAEGGMGACYLAEHPPSGMRKVVKYVLAACMNIPEIRERFKKECNAAKRLKGKAGIVDIDSYGEINGEMYLVMEYLDGVTLEAHIRQNGRLTPHHAFLLTLQILKALDALHREGIIHRDLKPSNVFLRYNTDERRWDVKLIDFGIVHDNRAGMQEFRTRQGQVIGTPGYMATEQYGKADQVTPATDLFACAVCLWEMLTGRLPWGIADNEFAQHERQLNHVPVWPSDVPIPHTDDWPSILAATLVPDPARRPQSAQVLALLLGQRLAPIPPFVMGGVQMIDRIVPRFLNDVPVELETVRHPHPEQAAALLLTPPTPAPHLLASGSNGGSFDAIPVSAVSLPVSAPTVSARPNGAAAVAAPAAATPHAAPHLTTLSASNGVSVAHAASPGARARSRLALVSIGIVLAVIGIGFGVSRLASRSSGTSSSIQPAAATNEAQSMTGSGSIEPTAVTAGSASSGATSDMHSSPSAKVPTGSAAVGAAAPTAPMNSDHMSPARGAEESAEPAVTTRRTSSPPASDPKPTSKPSRDRPTRTSRTRSTTTKPTADNQERPGTRPSTTTNMGSATGPRAGGDTFDPNAIME